MIATLISDFGFKDNSVAISKAILLKHFGALQILDLSHNVTPHSLSQCSYLLQSSLIHFPGNTVHISLFDVMKQVPASVLVFKVGTQFVVTADNGLISYAYGTEQPTVWQIEGSESHNYMDWLEKVAFFLKDLSEASFDLSKVKLVAYTPQVTEMPLKPLLKKNGIDCHVLYIDRYGNLVLNLTRTMFEEFRKGRRFVVRIPRYQTVSTIIENYSEVIKQEVFCIFNSSDYLEIGVKNSNAAQLLGMNVFENSTMIYNTIFIEFLADEEDD